MWLRAGKGEGEGELVKPEQPTERAEATGTCLKAEGGDGGGEGETEAIISGGTKSSASTTTPGSKSLQGARTLLGRPQRDAPGTSWRLGVKGRKQLLAFNLQVRKSFEVPEERYLILTRGAWVQLAHVHRGFGDLPRFVLDA